MRVTVIGAGYVGLTVSACLAELGHTVVCAEKDSAKLTRLREGTVPFHEPGLQDIVHRGLRSGGLAFAGVNEDPAYRSEVIFIAVGTPLSADGRPDLSAVDEAVAAIAPRLDDGQVLVLKSTVPVGTTDRIDAALRHAAGAHRAVACNPEFLSEGSTVADFFHPSRVIIGTHSPAAVEVLTALYEPFGCPILVTNPRTAEMIKYASNAFLAVKVSFINEIAMICEQVGADIATVGAGMGSDPRIGPHFLKAGIGFGGSCLPKDVRVLAALAREHAVSPSVLEAVLQVNDAQRQQFVEKVEAVLGGIAGKTLAVLGLAFKGGTSDARESPALDIAGRLLARGAVVRAFDPAAEEAAAQTLPALVCCPDAYEAADGADAILILTDWPEFEGLDWRRLRKRVRGAVVLDGRGLRVVGPATGEGFAYIGPGTNQIRHGSDDATRV